MSIALASFATVVNTISIALVAFSIGFSCKSLFLAMGSNPKVQDDLNFVGIVAISMLESMGVFIFGIAMLKPELAYLGFPIALVSNAMSIAASNLFSSMCINPSGNKQLKTMGIIFLSMLEVLGGLIFGLALMK